MLEYHIFLNILFLSADTFGNILFPGTDYESFQKKNCISSEMVPVSSTYSSFSVQHFKDRILSDIYTPVSMPDHIVSS